MRIKAVFYQWFFGTQVIAQHYIEIQQNELEINYDLNNFDVATFSLPFDAAVNEWDRLEIFIEETNSSLVRDLWCFYIYRIKPILSTALRILEITCNSEKEYLSKRKLIEDKNILENVVDSISNINDWIPNQRYLLNGIPWIIVIEIIWWIPTSIFIPDEFNWEWFVVSFNEATVYQWASWVPMMPTSATQTSRVPAELIIKNMLDDYNILWDKWKIEISWFLFTDNSLTEWDNYFDIITELSKSFFRDVCEWCIIIKPIIWTNRTINQEKNLFYTPTSSNIADIEVIWEANRVDLVIWTDQNGNKAQFPATSALTWSILNVIYQNFRNPLDLQASCQELYNRLHIDFRTYTVNVWNLADDFEKWDLVPVQIEWFWNKYDVTLNLFVVKKVFKFNNAKINSTITLSQAGVESRSIGNLLWNIQSNINLLKR